MNAKARNARDAFRFSLGGLSAKSSFVLMPVMADDRISRAWDERLRQPQENQPNTDKEMRSFWGRFWLRALRRAA